MCFVLTGFLVADNFDDLAFDLCIVSASKLLMIGLIAFTDIFPCAISGFSKAMLPMPMVNISMASNAGRMLWVGFLVFIIRSILLSNWYFFPVADIAIRMLFSRVCSSFNNAFA